MTATPDQSGLALYSRAGNSASTRQLSSALPTRLRFIVRENGGTVDVPMALEVIIGRRNSTLPIDVDLAPYEAAELGVSRQHIKLEAVEDRILASDLDTVNGSCLNGVKMTPRHVYPIEHGDVLKLGRLHLIVQFVFD
ncbi:MAG: FHA domain-containing protein [Anaerolineae bacterium]|nr:FHA domain-containing protein [Anaerolineae bacterium]